MNYREILNRLSSVYDAGEGRAVARLLLEKCFGLQWTDVLCGAVDNFSDAETERLRQMTERLEEGEPVQYVIGEAEFLGRPFRVTPAVLIPRPETEELVSAALREISTAEEKQHILDIGTGSGCIAVSLALELCRQGKDCRVEAWDISAEALEIARENARRLGAEEIDFRQVDILRHSHDGVPRFELIVSNPPYICHKERREMERLVTDHEPHGALFVPDDDPLLFYRAIAAFAQKALRPGGYLLFEVNRVYAGDTAQLLENSGFCDVDILRDQFSNQRIVKGKKKFES